jgi:hypothetical protein
MTVRAAFAAQGLACEALGSPFMGRLMPLIGARLQPGTAVTDRILNWPGDTSPAGDSVPLRLAGALHALQIKGLALSEVYPPNTVSDDRLWQAVDAALRDHDAHILSWLDSPPQTNEVRRAAVLLPALAEAARGHDGPVELLELGTSAGLNLRFDRFRLDLPGGGLGPETSTVRIAPDWTGPLPSGPLPDVLSRRGVDLNPLDGAKDEDRLRLLAYLWPDQPLRRRLTEAAIGVASEVAAEITQGDAGEWLEAVLARPAPDRLRIVFHTVAWQYFPDATKARALAAMSRTSSPLVQIAMEADGGDGAAITLTRWPSSAKATLGRASFHGLWVRWSA